MPNGSDASLAGRLNAKLHQLFVVLILGFVILSGFRPVMENVDLGWHVAQGRWMVQHGEFYRQDAFNYPNLGHAVIDEYPLFQVVLDAAWSLGWWGPCVLTSLIYAILVGVLIRAGRDLNLPQSPFLSFSIGCLLLYSLVAFPLRPHVATYLGVTILGVFLLRHRNETSWTAFWPMALLQIAWTNSHSGFVLGPAMVGLFGAEMIVRQAVRQKTIPWTTVRTWCAATVLILLACWVNPYGWARFGPPFYQDRLESIRAYVGEMEPLGGTLAHFYTNLTGLFILALVVACFRRRGAVSVSLLIFALFFYEEAQSVQKAWPIFGLFLPLLALSCGAFAASESPRRQPWIDVLFYFVLTALLACAFYLKLNPDWPTSLQSQWREYDHGRSERSVDAVAWMKAHGVDGRFFHRCEDGGYLQQEGFDHGETFADTGFGKYDEAFIHEVGLVNERPALVPRYLHAYQPDYIICSTFCYQWPYYLKRNGRRLIFYSPNSSVWTRHETRPDLPTISNDVVMAIFDRDIAVNGLPSDLRLYGRNIIALNSMGLDDFAVAKLQALPPEMHHAPWYWEAARFLCFAEPAVSPDLQKQLVTEAGDLHDDSVTAEFRAYARQAAGDTEGALKILEAIPSDQLGNYAAELLLKIYLDRKRPEALALARRSGCFDLRNGHHWQYLAQAEEQVGNADAAAQAWEKAVFYYPDDEELLEQAQAFADKYKVASLAKAIADSSKIYGAK